MSKTILLYKQITALATDIHKNLKLKGVEGYEFAMGTHWIPVAGTEFPFAAQAYPIVFASEGDGEEERITAILVVGLERGYNDYITADKQWRAATYVPAFIRRYPFALAMPDATQQKIPGQDFVVCFDAAFPGFNNEEGVSIFNEQGAASELLQDVVHFMTGFQNDLDRTRKFISELRRLDLLERRSFDISGPNGALFKVQDILIIDEKKFSNLSGEQLETLNREGFLIWIVAHLLSLANFPILLDLHLTRKSAHLGSSK